MKRLLLPGLVIGLLGTALLFEVAHAAEATFNVTGKFERIQPAQPTADPQRVEVIEVFGYRCPHCFNFLPYVDKWKADLPEHVSFLRMPVVFGERWIPHAKAYYTAEILGVVDEIHGPLFEAIHRKRRRLETKEALLDIFAEHGVDKEKFDKVYSSPTVEYRVRRSLAMQQRYGIRGTPSVVVNGKYRVTGTTAGSYPNFIKVINSLVDKEHKAMVAQQ